MKEIIRLAFDLAHAVETLVAHARGYYYEVMLSGCACPDCGGALVMLGESRCRCVQCKRVFDPTVAFQVCSTCNGRVRLRVCRYRCQRCGADVRSRFIFDGRAFDAAYFRERMAQSRERRRERQAETRAVAIECRSAVLTPAAAELETVPGLIDALNGLAMPSELVAWLPLARKGFDLNRYQSHLEANTSAVETGFDEIPTLVENARLDRIWRFIALIFMAHAGLVELRQNGADIMVIRRGADREGQGVPAELEAADGIA